MSKPRQRSKALTTWMMLDEGATRVYGYPQLTSKRVGVKKPLGRLKPSALSSYQSRGGETRQSPGTSTRNIRVPTSTSSSRVSKHVQEKKQESRV